MKGVDIDLYTKKLLLKTKTGNGNRLRVNFKDSRGSDAGGFTLELSSSRQYGLSYCTGLSGTSKQLNSAIPKPDKSGYRYFKIEKYGYNGQGLKVSCNGTTLLTFLPSDSACTGWSFWDDTWTKQKRKVTFSGDTATAYYAMVPYADCTRSNSTLKRLKIEPPLPVKNGVELFVMCPAGTVNTGGNRGVCDDGQIVFSGADPICSG